ncbi:DUF6339 family protein [Streptomyces sp. S186]|uniref:DUF6339 family protein n=1 Tax=Streptomyces sp. S186 TaxID=3434395 RepID=UPI003F670C95
MKPTRSAVPEGRIGRLSDSAALRVLTSGVLRGFEQIPAQRLETVSTPPPDASERWNSDAIRDLCDEAMQRFKDDSPAASDAWLAPRLHYTLRMTRAEATESALWNFLALCVAPDFVQWRWGRWKDGDRREVGQAARFCGPWFTQCFSRLWWAAEIFRDGKDYGPAEIACRNQDVLNTYLRQELVTYRPAARAVVRMLEQEMMRTGRQVNALTKLAFAASATKIYEVLAPDDPQDFGALQDWIESRDSAMAAPGDRLPLGPDDGGVSKHSVETLVEWFRELLAVAKVRGQKGEGEGAEATPLDSGNVQCRQAGEEPLSAS